ncbi:MAG TPA: DNA gyrase inhibitor YacG [Burkholderiales bacterium]
MQPVRTVACPRCGRPAEFGPQNKWRPFCSERCRMIDLGQWASESYRVATPESPDDEKPGSEPGSSPEAPNSKPRES